MFSTLSAVATLALLATGVATLLSPGGIGDSLAAPIAILAWVAALGVVLRVYAIAMELFMSWYSASSYEDGGPIDLKRRRWLLAPVVMQLAVVLACLPVVRIQSWLLCVVCGLVLAGMILERIICNALQPGGGR